jgi:endogenous inhibitor of DNA gyrase (YacG/DUF329 family)
MDKSTSLKDEVISEALHDLWRSLPILMPCPSCGVETHVEDMHVMMDSWTDLMVDGECIATPGENVHLYCPPCFRKVVREDQIAAFTLLYHCGLPPYR